MTTLLHRIQTLSDADAQRILTTFARNQPGYSDSTLSPELTAALRHEPDLTATVASTGDLARAALLLLADDPQHRPIIDAMTSPTGAAPWSAGNQCSHRRRPLRARHAH